MFGSKRVAPEKTVSEELLLDAFAKAMGDGDIVNFRLLFAPFSPARAASTERFESAKYAYLLPDDEQKEDHRFAECRSAVRQPDVLAHIRRELGANRPPQMPSELILMLADHAVSAGKYNSAAQAYELLRIRARMQEEFFAQADAALDAGDVAKGVRGYLIATGLAYDYAAFPEPLPAIPDFQTRALMLHGEYPETPGHSLPMMETPLLLQTALSYLLLDIQAAARLGPRPMALQLAFLAELAKRRDPRWPGLVVRYRDAHNMTQQREERLARLEGASSLAVEIEHALGDDPRQIPACLLGRTIDPGEWWQYLKELAYEHPVAALCVARQLVGGVEILVPRHRPGSPVAEALGLTQAVQETA